MGPLGFYQASRKAFNAIKAEFLASESVFNIHNFVPGPSPREHECVVLSPPGTSASASLQSRPGVKEGLTSSWHSLSPKTVIVISVIS